VGNERVSISLGKPAIRFRRPNSAAGKFRALVGHVGNRVIEIEVVVLHAVHGIAQDVKELSLRERVKPVEVFELDYRRDN
jgi:hypothetical protein